MHKFVDAPVSVSYRMRATASLKASSVRVGRSGNALLAHVNKAKSNSQLQNALSDQVDFQMRPRISMRGSVRPSVGTTVGTSVGVSVHPPARPSVRLSVGLSIHPSRFRKNNGNQDFRGGQFHEQGGL